MHQPPIPHVASTDPEIAGLIEGEARRQFEKVRLIPSENYASVAVLEATGSVLTNKYSEGYPGRRYYEGQQFIDPIETLARQRAQALFGVDHANVQPYSGSPAPWAFYSWGISLTAWGLQLAAVNLLYGDGTIPTGGSITTGFLSLANQTGSTGSLTVDGFPLDVAHHFEVGDTNTHVGIVTITNATASANTAGSFISYGSVDG